MSTCTLMAWTGRCRRPSVYLRLKHEAQSSWAGGEPKGKNVTLEGRTPLEPHAYMHVIAKSHACAKSELLVCDDIGLYPTHSYQYEIYLYKHMHIHGMPTQGQALSKRNGKVVCICECRRSPNNAKPSESPRIGTIARRDNSQGNACRGARGRPPRGLGRPLREGHHRRRGPGPPAEEPGAPTP